MAKIALSETDMVAIGPATVNYPPPEGKKPDAVHTLQTKKESALLYRYACLFPSEVLRLFANDFAG